MIVIVLPDIADEQRLLRDAKGKNQESLRVIYERYFPPVYQFIRLRVNDREQARDIAADVFVDFFVALRGSRAPHTSLRAWLFRVARNKLVDHYGREKQFPLATLDEWIPAGGDNEPESAFFQTVDVEHVRRAMRMLAAEQQEVLVLRFGQGLSLQETADLMDKSTSAIKSLQFRSVETLRTILIGEQAG
ncbi:MAG: RNA polymerase sigma factor [Chloroflexi bacterium]|nr:RNA polymerase sigma factor [Chloroflexota bacterium]MCC6891521.1 sigma-70 family RNA polymerase sigma factor [Anaerolineae bacterium]